MDRVATITNWIIGGALAAALTLAPIVPAFASCPSAMPAMATSAQMPMSKSAATPSMPCDSPCKDCSSDPVKKSCAGECACAPLAFAVAQFVPFDRIAADRLAPQDFATPVPIARPPDTPPPKFFA
jgi:hypothetical protein